VGYQTYLAVVRGSWIVDRDVQNNRLTEKTDKIEKIINQKNQTEMKNQLNRFSKP
jgi:hypothetical protein